MLHSILKMIMRGLKLQEENRNYINFGLSGDELIIIRRQWNDWRKIQIPLSCLFNFHVSAYSGGVKARSPYPMLYAIIKCTDIPEGEEFGHSCHHGPPPHNIKVCIVQRDNPKELYMKLRKMVDPDWDQK